MKINVSARLDYLRWLVSGLLTAVYLTINLVMPRLSFGSTVPIYLIQTGLWGLLALAIWKLPPYRTQAKIRVRISVFQTALLIGFCQVMLYAISGLFSGFGKSPSSFSLTGIVINLLYVGSMLLGMEFSRAWLVSRLGKRHPSLAVALVAIVFTLLSIPLARLTGFRPELRSLNVIGSDWLPLFMENLLATLLAMQAGPRASLIYRGLLAAFWWFVPILPNLDWGLKAVIGVVVPITGMLIVNRLAVAGTGQPRKRQNENAFPMAWILTAVESMLLAWFALGLFPVKPAVVPTGSMVPVFNPGDIAPVINVSPENVKLGDIIEYRTKTVNIVHRVIKIEKNGNFLTKGDANNSADISPVEPQNVIGKVVSSIPKVGWLALIIKSVFTH